MMKILQIHNEYKQFGGEDSVVEAEFNLLRKDHNISQYIVSNNSINSFSQKLNVFFNTHYSQKSYETFLNLLKNDRPDIVHVHNFFPLLTPSIFKAFSDLEIPSVFTLHNFRIVDPSAILMNNGKIDERSLTGSAYCSIPGKVYRNSFIQTAVVAHMIEFHRKRSTWSKVPDKFIALTNFAKSKFVEGGIPPNKILVKPNFIHDPGPNPKEVSKNFLYVGRLSEEKGIRIMLDAWNHIKQFKLLIVGEGPLKNEVQSYCEMNKNVSYMGKLGKEEVLELMKKSFALIFPSLWYEGLPMVIIESLACGTPVICSNIGSQKEIIRDNETGIHFRNGEADDLKNAVHKLAAEMTFRERLSASGREEFIQKYTAKKNLEILLSIYQSAISEKKQLAAI